MKVLLVEDSRSVAVLMAARIEAFGHQVVLAENGRVAVEAFSAQALDLVLMDIEMPVMDGFAAARQIREIERQRQWAWTPIIFLTASDTPENLVSSIEAGGDDFLAKSAGESVLHAKMKAMMRIAEMRQQLAGALRTLDEQAAELARWNGELEKRVAEGVAQIERLDRLRRFFSPAVANMLLDSDAADPLRPRRKEIVVMFLDLRGYTAFTEAVGPDEVMRVLGEFHQAMGALIMAYGGTLERFAGDGLMIFFNDPVEIAQPALVAAHLALDMMRALDGLKRQWRERDYSLDMGIGIAKGEATIGGIGFEGRRDYGAIGPVTNLAARLCADAQGGQIIVCYKVAAEIEGEAIMQSLGARGLKGFAHPLACFELQGLRPRR